MHVRPIVEKAALTAALLAFMSAAPAVWMAAHLRAPVGLWGVVCGGRIRLKRDGARVVFTHARERRADAIPPVEVD